MQAGRTLSASRNSISSIGSKILRSTAHSRVDRVQDTGRRRVPANDCIEWCTSNRGKVAPVQFAISDFGFEVSVCPISKFQISGFSDHLKLGVLRDHLLQP